MSKKKKSTTAGDTVARLIAEKRADRAEAALHLTQIALDAKAAPVTTPSNPPAAPVAVTVREQLARLKETNPLAAAQFALTHQHELLAKP